ncbi:unnamed protein product [Vitrella brassicaformis CCMP3155]|uniref:Uncharacterized protein n=1 Tax=Vitrella brassicaformis (strain CCMP3155) TaxID=1169540 RepID=A0A0G4EYF5_VITBC|nr:unnamed protein product [Vitrella brassicaformis CCMP3155]|mmetsp:Transcript_12332/g.29535  ORF Transcript_12332/g.29535 Transcript_12332/m.29535 type:complete len:157 (-) Transcript_12332:814-1284(-)|eukprot:CEM04175.1 unnamed protein product [Vitrella brassicaformis CCMP3155]
MQKSRLREPFRLVGPFPVSYTDDTDLVIFTADVIQYTKAYAALPHVGFERHWQAFPPLFKYLRKEASDLWAEAVARDRLPPCLIKDVFVEEGTPDKPIVIEIEPPNVVLDAGRWIGSFFTAEEAAKPHSVENGVSDPSPSERPSLTSVVQRQKKGS